MFRLFVLISSHFLDNKLDHLRKEKNETHFGADKKSGEPDSFGLSPPILVVQFAMKFQNKHYI